MSEVKVGQVWRGGDGILNEVLSVDPFITRRSFTTPGFTPYDRQCTPGFTPYDHQWSLSASQVVRDFDWKLLKDGSLPRKYEVGQKYESDRGEVFEVVAVGPTALAIRQVGKIYSMSVDLGKDNLEKAFLVKPYVESKTVYLNFYSNGYVFGYETRASADSTAGQGREACIELTYKPGDGL